jgi:hypothetical protein
VSLLKRIKSVLNNYLTIYRSEINVKSTTATLVVWLQNDNGFRMYKPSDSAIDAFLESYRPGRSSNSETENSIATNNNSIEKPAAATAAAT